MADDSGSAFPRLSFEYDEYMEQDRRSFPYTPVSHSGMSLRDYFAAQALVIQTDCQPLGARLNPYDPFEARVIAKRCYAVADAMLQERER